MIRSMTGYSRVEAEDAAVTLALGIRSTNHRFLDVQVRLPSALDSLETMVRAVHAAGTRAGLAGSLRAEHVPLLCALEPDIAGFRGALCDGARTGGLNRDKVRALREALPRFSR